MPKIASLLSRGKSKSDINNTSVIKYIFTRVIKSWEVEKKFHRGISLKTTKFSI